ncbi:TetR/AcrR family transcriptional regulator [Acidovorax sp. NCPPB 3576]|uniref:TetR/AcrR family transcriptional regulator n=1 Tax=Acidovorax sp. NCPPB 3576 TaxID=2940488 RepID=UPI00234A3320|nr:TetR/AcrR family transcriptional regulator [Acidovorax sp. NCPPB 3576]WCM86359.1 TetR/AcrR family transcriptional regulator [Acidovorax sp. NCPPB 3576]
MKTKSAARKVAILRAAASSFQENGFDGALMNDIAQRTPCSKVTLYAYFGSKEELFYAAVVQALDDQFHDLYTVLDDIASPVREVLTRFGERFTSLVCSDDVKALRRLVMAANGVGAGELQRKCFDEGPRVALRVCVAYFKAVSSQGALIVPDGHLAAIQLRALLEAEWLDSFFYNAAPKPTPSRVGLSVERAVDAFLRVYGSSAICARD